MLVRWSIVATLLCNVLAACGGETVEKTTEPTLQPTDTVPAPAVSCSGVFPSDPSAAIQAALPICEDALFASATGATFDADDGATAVINCLLESIGCSYAPDRASVIDSQPPQIETVSQALALGGTRTCQDPTTDQVIWAGCKTAVAAGMGQQAISCVQPALAFVETPITFAAAFAACMAPATLAAVTAFATCRLATCVGQGATCCDGKCLDAVAFQTDAVNCGSCGNACGGDRSCLEGRCVCNVGETQCRQVCCAAGQVCADGICQTPMDGLVTNQSWFIRDYAECDFSTLRQFDGATPQSAMQAYVEMLNTVCSGDVGVFYTVSFTLNNCTPQITISSNGAGNPAAFAVAYGCSYRRTANPNTNCPSCSPFTEDRSAPAAVKVCVAPQTTGNGSQFILADPPVDGECRCPIGTVYDSGVDRCRPVQ
jgi:hypothetical protein